MVLLKSLTYTVLNKLIENINPALLLLSYTIYLVYNMNSFENCNLYYVNIV